MDTPRQAAVSTDRGPGGWVTIDSSRPRLSIGLPVYNGEEHLGASLAALLGQTFSDFDLIISSNASTDGTDEICRHFQAQDSRIRFFRQEKNLGLAPNHDFVFRQSRGELFKWASSDDLYARDLVQRCVDLLDEHRDAVLAHSWTAAIDTHGTVVQAMKYPLATDAARAPDRLRGLLYGGDDAPGAIRADDCYGVIRADVLRRVKPLNSYYHADHVFSGELALHGPFRQHPDWLYFRRHHHGRAAQAFPTVRTLCSNLDPRRADRLRHPTPRLVAEYAWEYLAAIQRAPLTPAERRECRLHLARWMATRAHRRLPWHPSRAEVAALPGIDANAASPRLLVAGQEDKA